MLLLKFCLSVCPGDEGPHPVAPPLPPPAPRLARPLALPPAHAVPGGDVEAGMDGVPAPAPGRGGVPTPVPGGEEGMEGPDHGGDVTGRVLAPMNETESEKGRETGTGTGTGDATQHAGERGVTG